MCVFSIRCKTWIGTYVTKPISWPYYTKHSSEWKATQLQPQTLTTLRKIRANLEEDKWCFFINDNVSALTKWRFNCGWHYALVRHFNKVSLHRTWPPTWQCHSSMHHLSREFSVGNSFLGCPRFIGIFHPGKQNEDFYSWVTSVLKVEVELQLNTFLLEKPKHCMIALAFKKKKTKTRIMLKCQK